MVNGAFGESVPKDLRKKPGQIAVVHHMRDCNVALRPSSRAASSGASPDESLVLIVDTYGTHEHRVKSRLWRHPRLDLHVIPTSRSRLNLVERWFRELTEKRIRRGNFGNVPALAQAVTDDLDNHNQSREVFACASAEHIMAKIAKCKEALDAQH